MNRRLFCSFFIGPAAVGSFNFPIVREFTTERFYLSGVRFQDEHPLLYEGFKFKIDIANGHKIILKYNELIVGYLPTMIVNIMDLDYLFSCYLIHFDQDAVPWKKYFAMVRFIRRVELTYLNDKIGDA